MVATHAYYYNVNVDEIIPLKIYQHEKFPIYDTRLLLCSQDMMWFVI